MKNDITWAIGGEAGFGIMASGMMLAKTFSRSGYGVIASNEYPSLIRGGHNFVSVRITSDLVHAPSEALHLLIALNKETIELHKKTVDDHAYVMFDDKEYTWNTEDFPSTVSPIAVPFSRLITEQKANELMRNTIAIGATMALLGKGMDVLTTVIKDQFKDKGTSVIEENITIATCGYTYIKEQYKEKIDLYLEEGSVKNQQLVMNASEAVALGALAGGMKFAAIYPMTPINALIPLFADHAGELGIVYKQPEDEIAGITMAIGAAIGGAKSMVATSGGGFALMEEAVSMAGIMEVPVVIDLGMRPGPATGMPTWTEQGELQMVFRAGHGEFPRIILAPGDVTESFELAKTAFSLADQFQTPVFVLTDKYINETLWQIPKETVKTTPFDTILSKSDTLPFKRYALDATNGISKRSFPGEKDHEYIANSYEHDEHGFTTEEASMRKVMVDKRMRKMDAIKKIVPTPSVYGDQKADITFVSFGSLKGVLLDAIDVLKKEGIHAKVIHFSFVFPMIEETVKQLLGGEKRVVAVEQNATGQLASLIREETGVTITEQWHKYDGRQWTTKEIVAKTKGSL